MNFDIEKSLTYLFKEENWKNKTITGSALMLGLTLLNLFSSLSNYVQKLKPEQLMQYTHILIPALIAILVISLFCVSATVFAEGYYLKTFNQKIFKPNEATPAWTDWKNLFAIGVKSGLAGFIYISFFLLTSLISLLILIQITKSGKLVILSTIIFIIWEIITLLAISIILVGGRVAFATNLKFSSYFDYDTIKKIIFDNILKFGIYVLLITAIGAGIAIISNILQLTIIGFILIPFLYFYQNMVQVDIGSQFARMTYKMGNNENTNN